MEKSPQIYEMSQPLQADIKNTQDEVPQNFKVMFGIGIGFLLLVLVTMLSQIYVMTRYKNLHPLRQHSPRLMIISSIGNLFISLFLLIPNLIYTGCNMADQCPEYCKGKWLNEMSCVFGFLCFIVFEPMAVIPYWARTIRIYKIFKAQQYYFEQKKKPSEDSSFRWIKEQMMIRASAMVIATFLAIAIIMIIVYIATGAGDGVAAKIFYYMPSYSIGICFMNGMCDKNLSPLVSNHVNAALIWLVIINFFGNLFFLTCIYKLRNIKKEFNIRIELIITFLAWFITTQATLGLVIYQPHNSIQDWIFLLLIVRSLLSVVLSGTRPLFRTIYKQEGSNRFILLPPNQESIETLDMVLQIPIATDYFYEYLKDIGSREDEYSIYFFSLYVDLRKFDRAVSQGYDTQLLIQQALVIKQDYLDLDGEYYVEVRPEVLQPTLDKLADLQYVQRNTPAPQLETSMGGQINNLLFIELFSFVLEKLKCHFEKFKRSPIFVELEEEISRQEKLYEILVDASIITN